MIEPSYGDVTSPIREFLSIAESTKPGLFCVTMKVSDAFQPVKLSGPMKVEAARKRADEIAMQLEETTEAAIIGATRVAVSVPAPILIGIVEAFKRRHVERMRIVTGGTHVCEGGEDHE